MLPSQNRLPSLSVRQVMRSGKRVTTKELQLIVSKNGLSVSRFAFIVGANIDKRATARNRIKRLLRGSVRHLLPAISSGFDCVFVVRSNISKFTQPAIELLIKSILP